MTLTLPRMGLRVWMAVCHKGAGDRLFSGPARGTRQVSGYPPRPAARARAEAAAPQAPPLQPPPLQLPPPEAPPRAPNIFFLLQPPPPFLQPPAAPAALDLLHPPPLHLPPPIPAIPPIRYSPFLCWPQCSEDEEGSEARRCYREMESVTGLGGLRTAGEAVPEVLRVLSSAPRRAPPTPGTRWRRPPACRRSGSRN